jgi:hypothetical protein
MRKLARVTTTLVLAAVVLSGCGDDDADDGDATTSEPTSTPSDTIEDTHWGKPATGPAIIGDGYRYRVPKTWADVTKRAKTMQSSVDSAAAEKAATDGFADNISVGYQSSDASLEELETMIPRQLRSLVQGLEALPHVTIDGEEALHHGGPATSAGTKYFLEQFAAPHGDRIAIITFSLGRSLTEKERDTMVASVMASWKWTS